MISSENTEVTTAGTEYPVRIGFWFFLFSELLLIGGMLLLFASNKVNYSAEFHAGSQMLSVLLGALNTFMLITGALTISLSVTALKNSKKHLSVFLQIITLVLGVWFIINRIIEADALSVAGLSLSDEKLLQRVPGEILFFKFFYAMNAVHLVHIIVWIVLLLISFFLVLKNKITSQSYDRLQGIAVFYHVVTIIWIFFFPLFYLLS